MIFKPLNKVALCRSQAVSKTWNQQIQDLPTHHVLDLVGGKSWDELEMIDLLYHVARWKDDSIEVLHLDLTSFWRTFIRAERSHWFRKPSVATILSETISRISSLFTVIRLSTASSLQQPSIVVEADEVTRSSNDFQFAQIILSEGGALLNPTSRLTELCFRMPFPISLSSGTLPSHRQSRRDLWNYQKDQGCSEDEDQDEEQEDNRSKGRHVSKISIIQNQEEVKGINAENVATCIKVIEWLTKTTGRGLSSAEIEFEDLWEEKQNIFPEPKHEPEEEGYNSDDSQTAGDFHGFNRREDSDEQSEEESESDSDSDSNSLENSNSLALERMLQRPVSEFVEELKEHRYAIESLDLSFYRRSLALAKEDHLVLDLIAACSNLSKLNLRIKEDRPERPSNPLTSSHLSFPEIKSSSSLKKLRLRVEGGRPISLSSSFLRWMGRSLKLLIVQSVNIPNVSFSLVMQRNSFLNHLSLLGVSIEDPDAFFMSNLTIFLPNLQSLDLQDGNVVSCFIKAELPRLRDLKIKIQKLGLEERKGKGESSGKEKETSLKGEKVGLMEFDYDRWLEIFVKCRFSLRCFIVEDPNEHRAAEKSNLNEAVDFLELHTLHVSASSRSLMDLLGQFNFPKIRDVKFKTPATSSPAISRILRSLSRSLTRVNLDGTCPTSTQVTRSAFRNLKDLRIGEGMGPILPLFESSSLKLRKLELFLGRFIAPDLAFTLVSILISSADTLVSFKFSDKMEAGDGTTTDKFEINLRRQLKDGKVRFPRLQLLEVVRGDASSNRVLLDFFEKCHCPVLGISL